MKIERFCGGALATNCYYLTELGVLIDAPDGVAEEARRRAWTIRELWLTHGHFDHILDAGFVARTWGCEVLCHEADRIMLEDPSIWAKFGFPVEPERVNATRWLQGGEFLEREGATFEVLWTPGHSPGSVCYWNRAAAVLMGGDVLFAGGVGRWDLPGGDRSQLAASLRDTVLMLPDATAVHPGHGPSTTIEVERASNPLAMLESC